jgi:hypothetical protein
MTTLDVSVHRARTKRYLPPQHGAWAFLGLPLILGALVAPVTPLLAVLAVAWICAYPLSYAALGMIRSPRPERFRRPAAVWAVVVVPACVVLVWVQPWLLAAGAVLVILFAINAVYARRNDERSLANDLVFVLECSAIIPIMWGIGSAADSPTGRPELPVPAAVWLLAALCALVLIGSTLHVKSLIRERADPRYSMASKAYALGCLPAAFVLAFAWGMPGGAWLIAPFMLLVARAWWPMRGHLRPGLIGAIELACFVVTAVTAALAVAA